MDADEQPLSEIDLEPAPQLHCLNCGNKVSVRYCSHCGQDNSISRITLRRLFRHLADDLFSLESPLFQTLVKLSFRPGKVALDYVEGHRRAYTNPLKYCLLVAALYVVAYQILGSPAPEIDWSFVDLDSPDFMTMWEEMDPEFYDETEELVESFVDRNYTLFTLIFIPIQALCTRLVFFRVNRNFVEHCVLSLYVIGHLTLVSIPLIPSMSDESSGFFIVGFFSIWLTLWVVACNQFFSGHWVMIGLGSFVSFIAFFVTVTIIVLASPFAFLWVVWAYPSLVGN